MLIIKACRWTGKNNDYLSGKDQEILKGGHIKRLANLRGGEKFLFLLFLLSSFQLDDSPLYTPFFMFKIIACSWTGKLLVYVEYQGQQMNK